MEAISKENHGLISSITRPEYIVAIGGSAGFLTPLLRFFDHTEKDDISYVVLRHIGKNIRTELANIIQSHTSLRIKEVRYNMTVERNTIYILPSGFYMTIKNDHFHLHKRRGPSNCAIDIFLESLAEEYKEKSIAVILSGSGTNGTNGVRSIKQAGGSIIVQNLSSAEFKNMPISSIQTACVDDIALPQEMPAIIERYTQRREYKTGT